MLPFVSHYFEKIFLVALCVWVGAAAGLLALREHRIAYLFRGAEPDVIRDITDGPWIAQGPLSVTDIRLLTQSCADLGSANLALLVNPRARAGFFASCLRLMYATLARNPASARALAVKLRVMPRLDAASYSRAQAAAPAEPWPLTHRLLSLEAAGPLPDPMASVAARDMAAAFATPWGRDVLAGLYLRDDALRDLILRTAGDRPGAEQAAFLAAVQRILSGNG